MQLMPVQTLRLGPVKKRSTIRFESKHSEAKRIAIACSSRNAPKRIAKFLMIQSAFEMTKGSKEKWGEMRALSYATNHYEVNINTILKIAGETAAQLYNTVFNPRVDLSMGMIDELTFNGDEYRRGTWVLHACPRHGLRESLAEIGEMWEVSGPGAHESIYVQLFRYPDIPLGSGMSEMLISEADFAQRENAEDCLLYLADQSLVRLCRSDCHRMDGTLHHRFAFL